MSVPWPEHSKAEAARRARAARGQQLTGSQQHADERRARYIALRKARKAIPEAARSIGVTTDTAYKLYEPAWFEIEHATYTEARNDEVEPAVIAAVMGIDQRRAAKHEAAYANGTHR